MRLAVPVARMGEKTKHMQDFGGEMGRKQGDHSVFFNSNETL
jgi:hypothetical protein